MQTCNQENNFASDHLAVRIRDRKKITGSKISWNMTLILLICDFKMIKPSRKNAVVWLRFLLCAGSFSQCRSAELWECSSAWRGAALRCRLGTHPSCLGSADCQIFPHSSRSSIFIVDTFFSLPPSPLNRSSTCSHLTRCLDTRQYKNFSGFSFAILGATV